jgi:hypothetical protein
MLKLLRIRQGVPDLPSAHSLRCENPDSGIDLHAYCSETEVRSWEDETWDLKDISV